MNESGSRAKRANEFVYQVDWKSDIEHLFGSSGGKIPADINFESFKEALSRKRETYGIQDVILASLFCSETTNATASLLAADPECSRTLSRCFCGTILSIIRDIKNLSTQLKSFNKDAVVRQTVDIVMKKIADRSSNIPHIHWAPTQSGKTAFKVVKIAVYLTMNIPVVVMTKGRQECKELYGKFVEYLNESDLKKRIFCVYDYRDICEVSSVVRKFECEKEANVFVIPDTVMRVGKATELLKLSLQSSKNNDGRRCSSCALILDEADAIENRTEEENLKTEIALKVFKEAYEPIIVKVTATPIPTLKNTLMKDLKPFLTSAYDKIQSYVGVEAFDHFSDLDLESQRLCLSSAFDKKPTYKCDKPGLCKPLFLEDERQLRSKFPYVDEIPSFNSQCAKLVRREIDKEFSKGMLTLVITCPWVSPQKLCVFKQAAGVQDYFHMIGRSFIAIVVHSKFVYYRLPGHKYGFKCRKPVGALIEEIDDNVTYGLDMPIIIFGYYAMKRSRSFRSDKRVPTSMILNLRQHQSIENCRQAAGRCTFKGLEVLQKNRKTDNVLILCSKLDFEMIKSHDTVAKNVICMHEETGSNWEKIESELSTTPEYISLVKPGRKSGNFTKSKNKRPKKKRKHRRTESINVVHPLLDHGLVGSDQCPIDLEQGDKNDPIDLVNIPCQVAKNRDSTMVLPKPNAEYFIDQVKTDVETKESVRDDGKECDSNVLVNDQDGTSAINEID